jgi:hypothetical protein
VWRRVASCPGDWPACQPVSRHTRDQRARERKGTPYCTQGTGGEARGRGGCKWRGAAVQRCHVWCKNNGTKHGSSSLHPTLTLTARLPLASSSPHKYPLSHVPRIPSSATSATHDWQPSTRTHTRTQPLQIDPPVLPTLISTPTPSRPLAQASV